MKAYEKAWDLLSKINGQVIDDEIWNDASDYAKKDLKRKANIVIDEVIDTEMLIDEDTYVETKSHLTYWLKVRHLLNTL
jgi:predicted RNA methylase